MIGVLERLEELARRRNKTGEWARLTPWELIALLRVVRAAEESRHDSPELAAALSALQEEKPVPAHPKTEEPE